MDKVFEEQLKFQVIGENLERFSKLTFIIGNVYQHPNGSLKAVIFEIVDESNPFFFYSLKICEGDFSILKNSQGLLVDFLSFPKQTIQLLEKCMVEENEQNPRFSLVMTKDVNMAQVEIVELNGFRRLVHLSLKFVPPSEQKLRSELANAIKALKDKNANLVHMLEESSSSSEKRITDLETRLSERTLECERLRIEKEEKLTALSDRALMELEREKEKASEMETRIKEQYTAKFEELRNEYERNLDRIETRLNDVEGDNKVLQDQSQRFELSLRDAQAQLKASNEECKILNNELMVAKQKLVRMDSEFQSQDKSNQLMSNKISALEKDLRDKDVLIMKLQGQLGSAHETNRKFAKEMDKLESTVLRREEAITNVTEDLVKANQIIAKLHADNKSAATKLQARCELILQQEKVVENRESEVKSLKEDMKKCIEERIRIEDELKRHKENFEDANEKLQDQEKTLKTNETVISWLNQQITDLQKQLGTSQGLTSRQVAATLSNIGKQPHLGQLRVTRSESNKTMDDSDCKYRNSESPIDPIYFEPSHTEYNDTDKDSTANRDSSAKNTNSKQRVHGNRRPFLKSSSLPSKDKKEQKQASAYFSK